MLFPNILMKYVWDFLPHKQMGIICLTAKTGKSNAISLNAGALAKPKGYLIGFIKSEAGQKIIWAVRHIIPKAKYRVQLTISRNTRAIFGQSFAMMDSRFFEDCPIIYFHRIQSYLPDQQYWI